jgi:hypothetical protein
MPPAALLISSRAACWKAPSHSLIALAEAGHGIAVVPSTVRFMSKMTRIMPILQDGKSLGTWSTVSWDERRTLPVYAVAFVEELDVYSRRTFPGQQFNGVAPPVPQPSMFSTFPRKRTSDLRVNAYTPLVRRYKNGRACHGDCPRAK